jgi:hypothetical protein
MIDKHYPRHFVWIASAESPEVADLRGHRVGPDSLAVCFGVS